MPMGPGDGSFAIIGAHIAPCPAMPPWAVAVGLLVCLRQCGAYPCVHECAEWMKGSRYFPTSRLRAGKAKAEIEVDQRWCRKQNCLSSGAREDLDLPPITVLHDRRAAQPAGAQSGAPEPEIEVRWGSRAQGRCPTRSSSSRTRSQSKELGVVQAAPGDSSHMAKKHRARSLSPGERTICIAAI